MFRPLLSSVPSTTFYVGKANNAHRPMFSRNSSLTTSTSASSDQGATVAPDMEGSEHDQNELTGELERTQDPDAQDEVFIFDEVEETENNGQMLSAGTPGSVTGSLDADIANKVDAPEFQDSVVNLGGIECITATAEVTDANSNLSMFRPCEIMTICSKCRKRFRLLTVDGNTDVCEECMEIDAVLIAGVPLPPSTLTQPQVVNSEITTGKDTSINELQLGTIVPGLPERSSHKVILGSHENNSEEGLDCLGRSCPLQLVRDESELHLLHQQKDSKGDVSSNYSDSKNKVVQNGTISLNLRIDNSEGTGISVLLQPSSSSKWPVVQSRAYSATNMLCADPCKDSASVMRRSISRDSASGSSVDMGSSRQIDVRIQREISSRKIEMDGVRSDTDAKSQCSGSHSDFAVNSCDLSLPPKNGTEEHFNLSAKGAENDPLQESESMTAKLDSLDCTDMGARNFPACSVDFVDNNHQSDTDRLVAEYISDSQLLSHMERLRYGTSEANNSTAVDCSSCTSAKEDPWGVNERSSLDIEEPSSVPDLSVIAEQNMLNAPRCPSDISDAAMNSSSVVLLESQNDHDIFQDLQSDGRHFEMPTNEETIQKNSVCTAPEKSAPLSTLESAVDDHAHGTHGMMFCTLRFFSFTFVCYVID